MTANELIERAEKESGQRLGEGTDVLAILFGVLAREMGKNPFPERDDMAVGVLLMDDVVDTLQGSPRARGRKLIGNLLVSGISPDDIKALLGGEE